MDTCKLTSASKTSTDGWNPWNFKPKQVFVPCVLGWIVYGRCWSHYGNCLIPSMLDQEQAISSIDYTQHSVYVCQSPRSQFHSQSDSHDNQWCYELAWIVNYSNYKKILLVLTMFMLCILRSLCSCVLAGVPWPRPCVGHWCPYREADGWPQWTLGHWELGRALRRNVRGFV